MMMLRRPQFEISGNGPMVPWGANTPCPSPKRISFLVAADGVIHSWLSLKGLATSPLRLSNTLYWSLPMNVCTVICPQRYLEVSRYDDMYTVLFSTGISGQFRLTFLFSDVQHTPGSASSKEKSPRSLVAPGRCCCADGTTNPTCWSLWMAP